MPLLMVLDIHVLFNSTTYYCSHTTSKYNLSVFWQDERERYYNTMNLFTKLQSTSGVNYLNGKSLCCRLVCSSLLALTLVSGSSFQTYAAEPVEYAESIESSASSHSDAESIVKKAINSHSTYITVSGDETTLKSAKNAAFRALSSPLHDYEEGTINEVNSHINNGKCELVLGRVSTINEEKAVNSEVERLLPQFNQGSTYDKIKASINIT